MCSRRHCQLVGCVCALTLLFAPLYAMASDDSSDESSPVTPQSSSSQSDDGARANPEGVTEPREALQYRLDSNQDYEQVRYFSISESGDVGAWTFYTVITQTLDHTPIDHFSVRGNEIVDDSADRQLERILESTELLEQDELPAGDLLTTLEYTVNRGDAPVGSFDSDWIHETSQQRFPDVQIQPPELEETDDGWTIRYYVRRQSGGGLGAPPTNSLVRYQVDVSSDYSVDVDRETASTDRSNDSEPDRSNPDEEFEIFDPR